MRMRRVCCSLALLFLALGTAAVAATADTEAHSVHAGAKENPDSAGSDQAPAKPVLLFIKLRPSKTRSKADVMKATQAWVPKEWGAAGSAELSVIDNDAAVLTSASMPEALKAKDWLLQQQMVYEVELNQGGQVYRRDGDIPIEELRRGLSRNAQQERRQERWAWLRRTAKQQGVKIKRPRRRRGTAGGGGGRQGGQGKLTGNKDEL